MFRRIGRVILNNFGLKVLAVVLAIVLWLAIVNVADPNKSVTFTIPVEIVNADYLEEQGETYEILDNTNEITFTVEGPRSLVEDLTEDDFLATANLEEIDDSMTMVPIALRATSYSGQLEITSRQSDVMVQVEKLVTQEFDIEVVTDGTPAEDCYVESAQAEPSKVTVTGPKSKVDQIDSAQVSVSVDEAEEDFTTEEPIVLLDENGAELEDFTAEESGVLSDENGEEPEGNHLSLDVDEAEVSVQIFMTKNVPLHFVISGDPAEGYWVSPPECDVDSVVIVGDASTIRDVDEVKIDSARLDVTDAEQDITVQLTLSNYLPEGVTLTEGESESIEVTLPITTAYTRDVEMPTGNLTAANLADGLTMTIQGDSIPVHLTGPEDVINSVNANRLKGTVDAAGRGEGSYDLSVDVETDGSYAADATASVNITRTEE